MGSLGQKITKLTAVAIFSALAFSTNAMAIPLAVVGSVDNFVGHCSGTPSGDAIEIACIESFSGADTVIAIQKFSGSPGDEDLLLTLEAVDGETDTFAFMLPEEWRSPYLLLKTGNLTPGPGGPTVYSYVFENLSSTAYFVFSLDDGDFPIALRNTGVISHISAFQLELISTPLPAAAWMFIAALGGILGFRKVGAKRRS